MGYVSLLLVLLGVLIWSQLLLGYLQFRFHRSLSGYVGIQISLTVFLFVSFVRAFLQEDTECDFIFILSRA